MEAITNFKFSKKGIIIIVLSVIVLLLIVAILYIVGKRQQEISVMQERQIIEDLDKEIERIDNENSERLHSIFDNYRAGKYERVKDAIALSGLSTGTFYRELKEYESTKQ